MEQERESLRADIVNKHGTVHKFCRKSPQLNRSTVYMVLNGNYPGNMTGQMKRIKLALTGQDQAEAAFNAIKSVACNKCSKTGECHQCDKLFREQSKKVLEIFSS